MKRKIAPKVQGAGCQSLRKPICLPFRCCVPASRAPKPVYMLKQGDVPRFTLGAAGCLNLPWA